MTGNVFAAVCNDVARSTGGRRCRSPRNGWFVLGRSSTARQEGESLRLQPLRMQQNPQNTQRKRAKKNILKKEHANPTSNTLVLLTVQCRKFCSRGPLVIMGHGVSQQQITFHSLMEHSLQSTRKAKQICHHISHYTHLHQGLS